MNLQKYLGTLTDCILNVDHNTPVAHEFLSFLDNQSNSLQDKIRMMILEARMTSTVNCCDRLQNRLQNAEKSLTESSNLIAFLRYRVEQLENVNSVPRLVMMQFLISKRSLNPKLTISNYSAIDMETKTCIKASTGDRKPLMDMLLNRTRLLLVSITASTLCS